MNLTQTSVKRPLTIIMVFLVLIVFGGIGYKKMSINLMPDIEIPVVMVMTTWTGAGPQDVDEQVSQKVDEKFICRFKCKIYYIKFTRKCFYGSCSV